MLTITVLSVATFNSNQSKYTLGLFLIPTRMYSRYLSVSSIRPAPFPLDRAPFPLDRFDQPFSTGVSSGWLKAIPQPTLGLAFSPHEFVIAVSLWLGVPLFPLLPLCTCLSVIDQFGDHLLGYSHGPATTYPTP